MTDSDPDQPESQDDEAPSAAELEAAGQNSMFGGDDMGGNMASAPLAAPSSESTSPENIASETPVSPPPQGDTNAPEGDTDQPYRVLARKYRPQTFSELIGQEPMVRTLANAIERDRLAHAFLMTGVMATS